VLPGSGRETELQVGLVCDLLEEKWASMDLVGEMLYRELRQRKEVANVRLLRPPMRRRFSRFSDGRLALNLDRLANRFVDYPSWLSRTSNGLDLFHIVDHSYSQLAHAIPRQKPVVITCHDLDTFRSLIEPDRDPRPFWFRKMTSRILSGFQLAQQVICVSETVKRELLRHNLAPEERVTVIPNGLDPSCSTAEDPKADAEAQRLLAPAGNDPFLLHVGTTIRRKRIDVLLHVFAGVRQQHPNVWLVRAGGPLPPEYTALATQLSIRDRIIELPFVSREVLAAVYRKARLLLQVSEAEGFGLPVIEAMACGCPVVASDLAVFHEVAGDAAIYCPVADIDAWTRTVSQLLHQMENPNFRAALQQAGIARSRRFTWAACAAQTLEVYQRCLEARRQ